MFTHRLLLITLAALPQLLQAQATVTLTTSANPSQFGAPLTLTATVPGGGSTGRVTFFDGVNILGGKPLAAGSASLSTSLLSAGSHKLTAYYRDPAILAAGTSNAIAETVRAVTGGALVAQAPLHLSANSALVADFNGDGKADLAAPGRDNGSWWQVDLGGFLPIGSIAIWNRTDCCSDRLQNFWVFVSNTPFGASDTPATLQNRAGTFASHQLAVPNPSVTIPVSRTGRYVRVQLSTPDYLSLAEVQVFDPGDSAPPQNLALGKVATQSTTFTGYATDGAAAAVDGRTDGNFLHGSVTSTSLDVVNVSLGKGDGTFQAPVSSSSPGGSMRLGDFNGDGIADLALFDTASVTILLGNGDGTFRAGANYPANPFADPQPGAMPDAVIGDFNGDGIADILSGAMYYSLANHGFYFQAILLPGNGDGTFGSPISYSGAPPPFGMADFNGDGKPDLVGGGFSLPPTSLLFVFLGNGDGTATPNAPFGFLSAGLLVTVVESMLTGDFNGDGKVDLTNGFSVFLGKGDGAFQAPMFFGYPDTAAAIGDFNGDGILDLVMVDSPGRLTGILYGNGDGTFRQGLSVQGANVLAVADFNGDGQADILTATGNGNDLVILLSTTAIQPAASGGTPQTAVVGAPFLTPLEVTVKDGRGNPVSGIAVTFAAPTVGPSARLSATTAVTDSAGKASVTATANAIAGGYTVIASLGASTASFSLTNTPIVTNNLALGKPATQSSTYVASPFTNSTTAAAAVDGNTNGNFALGSVTATNADPNAWWQVDLGALASVDSIVIWNRTDCCGDRLGDYWVFVSDTPFLPSDTPATLQNRAGTFASHQTYAPNPSAPIAVNGAQGRYVRVQLSNPGNLSLAEVQVFGTGGAPAPTNLAQGRTATQSSTYPGFPSAAASSAVDGSTLGVFSNGSVTATNLDPNPWWQVDLGASAQVSSIVIWNRTDCCGERLTDYWVFVSDTPFLPSHTPATLQNRAGTFASHQTSAPNPFATIGANSTPGRYVRVQLSSAGYLSLAEVQVFGSGGVPPPSNLAQGKSASQSSTLLGASTATASSAVDGNTDGRFYNGSVTATNLDPNSWWQVDLGASKAIGSVAIYNRTDCCGDRLSDYWVFVSDTPFLASDTPATLQGRAGTFALHQTTAPNPSTALPVLAPGRYVRVQLSSAGYLSLAEVQVFGQ